MCAMTGMELRDEVNMRAYAALKSKGTDRPGCRQVLDTAFKQVDTDGSGDIDFDEFRLGSAP